MSSCFEQVQLLLIGRSLFFLRHSEAHWINLRTFTVCNDLIGEMLFFFCLQALFKAGEEKFGTDEQSFITILGNRSAQHLRKVFDAYMKMSGFEMEESIQKETSGSLKDLLLAVVKCARSVPAYFAETLYHAMKGAGTDDNTLIRVMVTRCEVDMLDIRAEFRKRFACSLHSMIKGDTGGDYRKTLLLLCGGDDA
ncbi:Annexin A5 [Ilyodon furcidens]|uniref:Annexin n=1 Tax=Ilyodon furcidens TaxID=33524 RepID=A0ABV0U055_9TELE